MTVVCFDGKTLAADKQASNGNTKSTVTKIHRVGDLLIGYTGVLGQGLEMVEWIRRGRRIDEFPPSQRVEDDFCCTVVIDGGRILVYERTPYPFVVEDPVYAVGSGRDFAIAAMFCGLSAREAAVVACKFDDSCGMGVDSLDVEPETVIVDA